MIADLIIQLFIAAARFAGLWPKPNRELAWRALGSLPLEYFEASEHLN